MKKYKEVSKKVPMQEYLKWDSLGSSDIKTYATAPYAVKNKRIETRAMRMGTALHTLLLEPNLFSETYYVGECWDRRLKPTKVEMVLAEDSGRIWLSSREMKKLTVMHDAVMRRSEFAHAMLSDGVAETVFEFKLGDVMGKCRPDYIKKINNTYFCVDVKKIAPKGGILNAHEIELYIANFGCHVQAAYYKLGLQTLLDVPPESVEFVNVFVQEPSDEDDMAECVCTIMPDETIAMGEAVIEQAMANIKRYSDLPTAESYIRDEQLFMGTISDGIPMIGLPGWYR